MQSTPVPPQVVEVACSPHRHRAPLVGAATDPCCHSSGLGWNPSFYRQQAPGPCSSGINSPCPTGLEWPSVFFSFTHQAKTWEAETLQGQAPQLHQARERGTAVRDPWRRGHSWGSFHFNHRQLAQWPNACVTIAVRGSAETQAHSGGGRSQPISLEGEYQALPQKKEKI